MRTNSRGKKQSRVRMKGTRGHTRVKKRQSCPHEGSMRTHLVKKAKRCPHERPMRTNSGEKGKAVSAWSAHEVKPIIMCESTPKQNNVIQFFVYGMGAPSYTKICALRFLVRFLFVPDFFYFQLLLHSLLRRAQLNDIMLLT